MDFSYFDKPEYLGILIFDTIEKGIRQDKSFFIRKYNITDNKTILHRHTYIQINYVNSGCGYHYINDKKIEISKGDIFIVPPYVPHKIIADDNNKIEVFEFEFTSDFILPNSTNNENCSTYLEFAYLKPFMVEEENVKLRFTLDGVVREEVERILNEVLEEYTLKNDGYVLLTKALLIKLLILVNRSFTKDISGTEAEVIFNKYKSVVQDAKEYIEENFSQELTLDKIANAVSYSKSRFCFLFKAVAGETCIEYLNRVRIEKAKELLKNTSLSITEISFNVGYYTTSNFNKNFKLITGVTPKSYRLSILKGLK